jgi:hypothetical protein
VGLRGTFLGPGLHDAVVLAGGLDHLAAFPDIVGNGLFDVYVLARLAGPDRHERMPVVGGRRGNGVDFLVFEQLTDVRIGFELVAFLIFEGLGFAFHVIAVGVTDGHQAGPLAAMEVPHVASALATDPDDRHADIVIGTEGA